MAKMATWTEVNAKVGSEGTPANQCPAKADILATGRATVGEAYTNNQLVPLNAISSAAYTLPASCRFTANIFGESIIGIFPAPHMSVSLMDGDQYDIIASGTLNDEGYGYGLSSSQELVMAQQPVTHMAYQVSAAIPEAGFFSYLQCYLMVRDVSGTTYYTRSWTKYPSDGGDWTSTSFTVTELSTPIPVTGNVMVELQLVLYR